ncbi:MAG TPA: GntR family transcriptional regulator [Candidatus Methylomirabilis sp.]|nr:GntR family transcriptional regulator [Candidatus Methylomirabilis sp.]HSB78598.1 GntR family transcriptional regulator [Candidatus Methylomirabilis sp.]
MGVAYRTMQEVVYDAIRDAVLSGRYPPGKRLVADEIARELGVSRMPVREALQRLQVAGLIAITRHKGAVVSELSEPDIVEIYHIRAVLDGLATRLAAPNLTQTDHQALLALLEEMEAAVKDNDVETVLAVNRKFHVLIWKAARAPRLQELMENLYDASQRFRNISVLIPGRLDQITQEHRLIAEALARGDAPAAEQHANEHHEGTARRLLTSLGAEREHAVR